MNTPILPILSPDEREQLRAVEANRRHDERERRIAAQVERIEREVRALRDLLRAEGEGEADAS